MLEKLRTRLEDLGLRWAEGMGEGLSLRNMGKASLFLLAVATLEGLYGFREAWERKLSQALASWAWALVFLILAFLGPFLVLLSALFGRAVCGRNPSSTLS